MMKMICLRPVSLLVLAQRDLISNLIGGPFVSLGNPRERSLPGKGPGEKQYTKTRDQTGRMISEKPANKPFLAWQRYKAAEEDKARRRAAGEVIPEDVPKPWTLSSYLLAAFFTIGFLGYVGNWVTGSPAWGYEAAIAKQWKQVNPWKVSPRAPPFPTGIYHSNS